MEMGASAGDGWNAVLISEPSLELLASGLLDPTEEILQNNWEFNRFLNISSYKLQSSVL